MKNWRNLPPALLAMFVIEAVSIVGFLAWDLGSAPDHDSVRLSLTETGLAFATYALGLTGFLELARRSTGRVALGFKVSAIGFGLALANQIWWHLFQLVQPHWSFETVGKVQEWTYFTIRFVPLLGVVIAASVARRRAAIAGAVVLFASDPVPWLAARMYGWLASGWKSHLALNESLYAASFVALVVLTVQLATPGVLPPASEGSSGFRTVASGLWLRVIAACTVAGLTLLLVLGKAGEGSAGVLKLAMISSAVVNAISLAMIARGVLSAVVADVPAVPLAVSAAATLWGLGVSLAQLPAAYRMLYGDGGYGSGSVYRDYADALSIVAPIVAIVAIGIIATAIAGFAARRGLEQLRFDAQGKGLGFVTLMVAALGLQQWLLPKATSEGSLGFFLLAAAACSLWATVLMARLCALAADSLQAEPGLPTATLQP